MFAIDTIIINDACNYNGLIYGKEIAIIIMVVIPVVFVGLFLYSLFNEYGKNRFFIRNVWREYLSGYVKKIK